MIDSVRQWVAGICCAAVACTLLELLHPNGNLKKTARFVTTLFFLAVLVLPIKSFHADLSQLPQNNLNATTEQADAVQRLMHSQIIAAAEEQVRQTAHDTITQIHLTPLRIETKIERETDGTYYLSVFDVYLHESDRAYAATVRMRLYRAIGTEPRVLFQSEK